MFNIVMTLLACALLGLSLPQIDGGYLYLASFALGSFILGVLFTNEF
jgi:hypothetical protein